MPFILIKPLKKPLKRAAIMILLMFTLLTTASSAPLTADEPIHEVLIFISFSMPISSLQAWAVQAQKIHAPLVIRGLVNDSFSDTQKAVKQIIQDQPGGVLIDPRLFDRYHITQVPTVVMRHADKGSVCLANQSCWRPEKIDQVTGDGGLESALRLMVDRGDNDQAAQQLLAAWRQP